MIKHDFFIVSVGHYDSFNTRYIRPLKIYASLSSAKRFVKKRRESYFRSFELDWYCIHRLNFDFLPIVSDYWYSDNGGKWVYGKD